MGAGVMYVCTCVSRALLSLSLAHCPPQFKTYVESVSFKDAIDFLESVQSFAVCVFTCTSLSAVEHCS
jgi:hypothetical protein